MTEWFEAVLTAFNSQLQPALLGVQFFSVLWLDGSFEQHPGPQHPQPGPQQQLI